MNWREHIAELARAVRDARRLLGLSQEQLAVMSGTSQSLVSRIEGGRTEDIALLSVVRVVTTLSGKLDGIKDALPRNHSDLFEFAEILNDTTTPGVVCPMDEDLRRLLRAYHNLGKGKQKLLAVIALTAADQLNES